MENERFPQEWQQMLDAADKLNAKASNDRLFNNVMGLIVTAGTIAAMMALAPAIESLSHDRMSVSHKDAEVVAAEEEIRAEMHKDFVRAQARTNIILGK